MRNKQLDPKLAGFVIGFALLLATITFVAMLEGVQFPWMFSRFKPGPEPKSNLGAKPFGCAYPADPPKIEPLDYINRIHVYFTEETQRFGIVCPRLRDPLDEERPLRLTGEARGGGPTNNTCVSIEGYEYMFGREVPGSDTSRKKAS
jgi:hypothetical protein